MPGAAPRVGESAYEPHTQLPGHSLPRIEFAVELFQAGGPTYPFFSEQGPSLQHISDVMLFHRVRTRMSSTLTLPVSSQERPADAAASGDVSFACSPGNLPSVMCAHGSSL